MIPLHVHSHFSFGWGTASPAQLCRRAKELGYAGLALTDREGLHGVPEFLDECGRHGLAPVLGLHLERPDGAALALAEGRQGWSALCRLASAAALDPAAGALDLLRGSAPGLHVASPSLSLLKALRGALPPQNLYAELQWRPGWLADLAQAERFQLLATAPVTFLTPDDLELHRLVRSIHCRRALGRLAASEQAPAGAWLQSPAEARAAFQAHPQALQASESLALRCRADKAWFKVSFPGWRCPDGQTPAQHLRALCDQGLVERFSEDRAPALEAALRARLTRELTLIEAKGFVEYFLVVRAIVRQSPRTCGRGSGAASLVSYLLGITQVDPLAHNLYFERFLNEGREDYPDLDVDFAWDERDAVQAWALRAFGEGRAALVANVVRYQPRMALRETARAFGLAPDEIGRVTAGFGWRDDLGEGPAAVKPSGHSRAERLGDPWDRVFALARRLVDMPRLVSVHCGGIVITAGPLQDHAPIQAAAKTLPGAEAQDAPIQAPLLQWDKDGTEAMGLVKIDLLGNRSLAVIRDGLAAVAAHGGPRVNEARFRPHHDAKVLDLLKRGDTLGCFYIESPATRLTLQKVDSIDFDTLVVISSIIRPAAHRHIEEWLRRRRGEPWQGGHPILAALFPDTFGIPVYQEHVNQLAEAVAGFDPSEADRLRKVLGKKSKVQVLADFKQRFFDGGLARGYTQADLEGFWDFILSFEGYSFCKPHSASYALISYQSVWLRAHHPAEFMAAVLSNHGGFYHAWAYVSECRRMGLTVLGPCVNEGGRQWQGQGASVRVGLADIMGLGQACLDRILTERTLRPFAGVEDFLARVRPARDEAMALVHAGALDALLRGLTRPQALWLSQAAAAGTAPGQASLDLFADPAATCPLPPLPEFAPHELTRLKQQALGFAPEEHAFAPWRRQGKLAAYVPLNALAGHVDRPVRCLGLAVTRKEVQTRGGKDMCFVSLEDDTALAEATLFPDAHRRYGHLLDLDREPLIVEGIPRLELGALSLEVTRLSQRT